jgi:Uma2 family endonuclease
MTASAEATSTPVYDPSRMLSEEEIADVQARFAELAITEDDTPVDNVFSEKQMRLLTEALHSSWPGPGADRTFVAMANVGLFYNLYAPAVVPDVLLSLDVTLPANVWAKHNRSYVVWEKTYKGKVPDIVIEIVSNKEGEELGEKRDLYARIGVRHYVVYDPELHLKQGPLQIFRLNGHGYRPDNERYFAEVTLGLTVWSGVYEDMQAEWLRWCDAEGVLVSTGAELAAIARQEAAAEAQRADAEAQRADTEARRADTEARRADAEAQRADAEAQRAVLLAAKLRELGIDPERL